MYGEIALYFIKLIIRQDLSIVLDQKGLLTMTMMRTTDHHLESNLILFMRKEQ